MGALHGPQDRRKKDKTPPPKRRGRRPRWQSAPDLSRAERVIAFLESLPITKGVLAGQKMKLFPVSGNSSRQSMAIWQTMGGAKYDWLSSRNRAATAKRLIGRIGYFPSAWTGIRGARRGLFMRL